MAVPQSFSSWPTLKSQTTIQYRAQLCVREKGKRKGEERKGGRGGRAEEREGTSESERERELGKSWQFWEDYQKNPLASCWLQIASAPSFSYLWKFLEWGSLSEKYPGDLPNWLWRVFRAGLVFAKNALNACPIGSGDSSRQGWNLREPIFPTVRRGDQFLLIIRQCPLKIFRISLKILKVNLLQWFFKRDD